MEINNPASRGVANSALGLGIAGTALGILNGGLGNILNTGTCGCATTRTVGCGCNEDHYVDRYEAAQSAEIARLNTELKLRDANTYTMGEWASCATMSTDASLLSSSRFALRTSTTPPTTPPSAASAARSHSSCPSLRSTSPPPRSAPSRCLSTTAGPPPPPPPPRLADG